MKDQGTLDVVVRSLRSSVSNQLIALARRAIGVRLKGVVGRSFPILIEELFINIVGSLGYKPQFKPLKHGDKNISIDKFNRGNSVTPCFLLGF